MSEDRILLAVQHLPGPRWKPGLDPRQQEGIGEHVGHWAGFLAAGKLLLGGPFLTDDLGGLAVAVPGVGREELGSLRGRGSAVTSGLLRYQLWTWFAAMRGPGMPGGS